MCSFNNRVLIFLLTPIVFFLIIFQHVMLIIRRKQWPMITSIKNCLNQCSYIQMDIICDLWFGNSVYYYFDMIFIKILIKSKFLKATRNHPPLNNCNSIDSKWQISLHTTSSFQFQKPWHHLGDFLTYANEIIQFAKDHPCNQNNDFECHYWSCWKVHPMISSLYMLSFQPHASWHPS